MMNIKPVYKFCLVILLGCGLFLLDYYELEDPFVNEVLLLCISLLKSGYFIYYVFERIRSTAHKSFDFREFLMFVIVSIMLFITSYAMDYYCLFRIKETAFLGVIHKTNIVTEFITFLYYSISVFTTAGFGDVKPNATTTQVLVSTELLIAFFFTILVIANISHIRESYKNNAE